MTLVRHAAASPKNTKSHRQKCGDNPSSSSQWCLVTPSAAKSQVWTPLFLEIYYQIIAFMTPSIIAKSHYHIFRYLIIGFPNNHRISNPHVGLLSPSSWLNDPYAPYQSPRAPEPAAAQTSSNQLDFTAINKIPPIGPVYLGGEVWFITHFSFRKVPTQLGRFHR